LTEFAAPPLAVSIIILILVIAALAGMKSFVSKAIADKKTVRLGDKSGWQKFRWYGKPKWREETGKPVLEGTITSDQVFHGEPWFTQPNLVSVSIEMALIAITFWCLQFIPAVFFSNLIGWVEQNQFLTIAFGAVAFLSAIFVGAIRQGSNKMMSNVIAFPSVDDSGIHHLVYLGDVPSMAWQYSPWPRLLSWVFVTTASLVTAIIGAYFSTALTDIFPTVPFSIILIVRWAVSSIPARLLED
jgi:hypothetical protein